MENTRSSVSNNSNSNDTAGASLATNLPPGILVSAQCAPRANGSDEIEKDNLEKTLGDDSEAEERDLETLPHLKDVDDNSTKDRVEEHNNVDTKVVALMAPLASAIIDAVNNANSNNIASKSEIAPKVDTGGEKSIDSEQKAKISSVDSEEARKIHMRKIWRSSPVWQYPVALACILLGVMVGLQYRVQSAKGTIQIDDRRKLVELVRTMESERNKMSNELKETRAHMVELEESSGKREQISKQLQDQLVRLRIESGLTGMKGPGVVVSLNDSPRTAPATEDNYFYIVHDVDLTALVNELWAAGAEAVCVNEQRIVTRSSIRCVGPAVLVNGVRIVAPYVVKAIGSKDLETALRMPGGFLNSMAPLISKGGEVKMNSFSEVVIPPYEGSNSFRYSKSFENSLESTSLSENKEVKDS